MEADEAHELLSAFLGDVAPVTALGRTLHLVYFLCDELDAEGINSYERAAAFIRRYDQTRDIPPRRPAL